MADEAHDMRMAVGQSAMAFSDAIDDELIAQLVELRQALSSVATELKGCGVEPPVVLGILLGACLDALDYDYPRDDQ